MHRVASKKGHIALSCVEKLLPKTDDETKQLLLQSPLSEAVVTDTPGDFVTIEFVVTNIRVVSTYLSSLMTTSICSESKIQVTQTLKVRLIVHVVSFSMRARVL